jgi:hypothetical protein
MAAAKVNTTHNLLERGAADIDEFEHRNIQKLHQTQNINVNKSNLLLGRDYENIHDMDVV